MIQPKRNLVMFIIGVILIIKQLLDFPQYLKSSMDTKSSALLFLTVLIFLSGSYLVYISLYSRKRL